MWGRAQVSQGTGSHWLTGHWGHTLHWHHSGFIRSNPVCRLFILSVTQLSDGASVVSNKQLWPGQRALNVMSVTGPGSHMYAIQILDTTGTALTI